jgi:hypothetical protein
VTGGLLHRNKKERNSHAIREIFFLAEIFIGSFRSKNCFEGKTGAQDKAGCEMKNISLGNRLPPS